MLTALLGGPLDGAELVLTGFTRQTYSLAEARTEQGATVFEAGPPQVVCNDDGNFVACWPDGFRIWPQVSEWAGGGFRHVYRAVEGYGYRFDRSDDIPLSPIA